ncbi:MAG: PepSY domain-containing protein [Nanoarchaeota archaeon]
MKRGIVLLFAFGIFLLLILDVASANWFGDFWSRITGRQTDEEDCYNECSSGASDCPVLRGREGYRTCGNYDSDSCTEWSSVTECSSGQTCSNGACVATTPSCSDECSTSGVKQCSGSGYQTCGNYDSDSCLEWSTETACSSGQTCSGGACVSSSTGVSPSGASPTCTNDCTSGAKQCSGTGFQICGNYDSDSCTEWSSVSSCSAGASCSNGVCSSSGSCTFECDSAGLKECSGAGFRACGNYDSDSCYEWSTETACSSGQTCLNGVCSATRNTGGVSGEREDGSLDCSDECELSGARECSGEGYKKCGNFDDDGCLEWGDDVSCERGEICLQGACIIESELINDETEQEGVKEIEARSKIEGFENRFEYFKFKVDSENSRIISEEGVEVESDVELNELNGKVYVNLEDEDGEKRFEVRVDPDYAIKKAKDAGKSEKLLKIELVKSKGKVVYAVKSEKSKNFFRFIRFVSEIDVQVDAQNGKVVSVTKPWWNYFAKI